VQGGERRPRGAGREPGAGVGCRGRQSDLGCEVRGGAVDHAKLGGGVVLVLGERLGGVDAGEGAAGGVGGAGGGGRDQVGADRLVVPVAEHGRAVDGLVVLEGLGVAEQGLSEQRGEG
jgi:hypothetical protein